MKKCPKCKSKMAIIRYMYPRFASRRICEKCGYKTRLTTKAKDVPILWFDREEE